MPLFKRAEPKPEEEKPEKVEVESPKIDLEELDVMKEIEAKQNKPKINWFEDETEVGELSVDVYEEDNHVIIKSTVAGVRPDNIEVVVDDDTIAIRGKRQQEETIEKDKYFYQECYWGGFERILKLPVEVNDEGAEAILKNGVLTVRLTKIKKPKSVKVPVKE